MITLEFLSERYVAKAGRCLSEVHAKNEDDGSDDGDDMYADEYDDTDKSRASSSTTVSSGTTAKATSTTGSPAVIIFGDADDSTEQDEYACPDACSCFEGMKYINCSHRGLLDIPSTLPSVVIRLDLSHNNLKRLNVEALQNATGLQELTLSYNAIEQFDKELLLKLDKLELLDLSSNQLSHLDSDCFAEASKSLRRLYLSNNPIVLPDNGPFLELPELEALYLVNCNLTEIPDETFKELGGLELLDLFGNQFDEEMSVDMFESLTNLIHLRLPPLSENTVRELCEKLERIDVIDITSHNISCFYLASESSFEDSIIVDLPKTPEPVYTTKEPTTPRPTRKPQKTLNEIMQDYKSSTSKLESSDLALQPTTTRSTEPKGESNRFNGSLVSSSQSGSPSSASITHTAGNSPAVKDGAVIKTSSTGSDSHKDGEQTLLSSISPETMKQILMGIIGVTVLSIIIGLICRRTGMKNKLCGTKRRPAPTDQVRPAEEVPLNKV
uniref:Uncharacterized protein n=1 Tax=Anopheles stephensi TaxID=30069 RepID=A0A182Y6W6_ANOST